MKWKCTFLLANIFWTLESKVVGKSLFLGVELNTRLRPLSLKLVSTYAPVLVSQVLGLPIYHHI